MITTDDRVHPLKCELIQVVSESQPIMATMNTEKDFSDWFAEQFNRSHCVIMFRAPSRSLCSTTTREHDDGDYVGEQEKVVVELDW